MAEQYANCPFCGEQIPAKANACPHCGSDELTGWSEKTYLDGIDYDYEDQYEEIKAQEFFQKPKLPLWQMVIGASMLLIVTVMLLFSNLW